MRDQVRAFQPELQASIKNLALDFRNLQLKIEEILNELEREKILKSAIVTHRQLMNTTTAQPTTTQPKSWTVQDYYRMSDLGILPPGQRTELIDGEIFVMAAKNPPHTIVTQLARNYLEELFATKIHIRSQDPVRLNDKSEPEPDIAVVQPPLIRYLNHHPHPEEIFLLIEVADTTLNFDRKVKAAIYARSGIADYWIVDVNGERVFVFRRPEGEKYLEKTVFRKDGTLTPLAFPETTIDFCRFFP